MNTKRSLAMATVLLTGFACKGGESQSGGGSSTPGGCASLSPQPAYDFRVGVANDTGVPLFITRDRSGSKIVAWLAPGKTVAVDMTHPDHASLHAYCGEEQDYAKAKGPGILESATFDSCGRWNITRVGKRWNERTRCVIYNANCDRDYKIQVYVNGQLQKVLNTEEGGSWISPTVWSVETDITYDSVPTEITLSGARVGTTDSSFDSTHYAACPADKIIPINAREQ